MRMAKNISVGLFLLAIVCGILFYLNAKTSSQKSEVIKVGAVLPLSGGGLSPYGVSAQNAILLAIENSGMKDRIKLIVEDDKGCQAKDAVNSAQKLVNVDHVQVILGPMCTSPALAIAPVAETGKVVVVTSASGKNVTEAGDYIFRSYASDSAKNIALAKYMYGKGYRKAAFIHDASQEGTISQRDDTREEFVKLGGQVVADEAFVSKDKDMRTQLNKIKNSGADVVFMGGLPDEIVLFLRQARTLGITSTLASTESSIDDSLIALAGKTAEGYIIPSAVPPTNKEVSVFVASYKAKYGVEPKLFAAESYDATMLLIKATLSSNGSGESIKAKLQKLGQNYQGASGVISFDTNGDVQKPIRMQKVSSGKLVDAE